MEYAHALGPRHVLRAWQSPPAHPRVRAVAQSITIKFDSGMVDTYELESLRHLWPVIEAPTP